MALSFQHMDRDDSMCVHLRGTRPKRWPFGQAVADESRQLQPTPKTVDPTTTPASTLSQYSHASWSWALPVYCERFLLKPGMRVSCAIVNRAAWLSDSFVSTATPPLPSPRASPDGSRPASARRGGAHCTVMQASLSH